MNNCKRGIEFEQRVETILRKKLVKYLSQPTMTKSGEREDILIKTINGRLKNLSCKRSLRERYKQSIIENEHIKESTKRIVKTIIITEDSDRNIINTKKAIKRSKYMSKNIQDVIHIDDLEAFIDSLNLGKITGKEFGIKRFVEYRSNV